MIGYEELVDLEVSGTPEQRDAFFADIGVNVDDLLKMGHEMTMLRLQGIPEGATLTAQDIELAMLSTFLFGIELAWRLRDQIDA